MKAIFIREHGEPSVIEYGDMPEPEAGPGEVVVRVRAAALNRLDLYTRAGLRGTKIRNWAGASHRPQQAADGWEKVFAFYERHLG